MKKSAVIGLMGFAMAMAASTEQGFDIVERGNVGSGRNPKPNEPIKLIPFNKSEGVVKMIEDYNLIINGKSKKGKRKQAMITSKIDKWLEDGLLKEEDIENFPVSS